MFSVKVLACLKPKINKYFKLLELNKLACISIAVFVKIFLATKKTRNAVLLVGLCDSGKTLLFSRVRRKHFSFYLHENCNDALEKLFFNRFVFYLQLLTGKFIRTVTSINESRATYRAKNDKVPKKKPEQAEQADLLQWSGRNLSF